MPTTLRFLVPSIIAILIGTTTLFHKTLLLVEVLALLTPLRRLVLAVLFLFVALFLRLVDSATVVFRGAVHSH